MAPAQDAGPKPRGLPYVLFDNIEIGPKDSVVEDFLGVGEVSCWYGEPGAAKSVLIEDLGLHVAAVRAWHNRAVAQGAVLYIALERAHVVKRRAVAFKIKHKVHALPFAVLNKVLDFRDAKTAGIILETVADIERTTGRKVVLIIVDTISRALCGGDENSPKDMGALVNTVGRIQEGACGAHVALLHHVPHGADRMRGHGLLLGAVDTTVHVVNKIGARSATIIKNNDGDEGHRVNFTLESVEVCRVAERITTAPIVVPLIGAERVGTAGERKSERKLNDNQRCFMDILRSAALDAPADLKDAIGVPSGVVPIQRGTLKRALVARGWIEETQSDKSRSTVTNMINALAGKGVIGATRTHLWVIS